MAASAETLQFEQTLYPEIIEQSPRLFDADKLPELQFARRRFRQEAEAILEENRQLLMDGKWEVVPIPVDALGTGRKVVETAKTYGIKSHQYEQSWLGLLDDCDRLYGETERKNTWEYFPGSVQTRDEITGDYFSKTHSITGIVEGGLSPVAKKGEQPLRIDDYVEEMTYKTIGDLDIECPVSSMTILECPDWVIEEYEQNPDGAFYGYVPSISKLMLRGMTFYNKLNYRVEEQLALPGDYITPDVALAVLEDENCVEPGSKPTKDELHGKQFLSNEAGDVFAFAKLLDAKASQLSGKNIFMGEEVDEDHSKNYEKAKTEALERHRKLRTKSLKLGRFIVEHAEAGTDRWLAETLISNFVDHDMKTMVRHNPDLAEIIYDQKTADGFREVKRLESQGLYHEANKKLEQIEKEAPPVSYCGAGSCGLEDVNPSSTEAKKAAELGLKGNQLRDKERQCPSCGKKAIHYDKKGSKVCTKCEKTEIKG